LLSILETTAIDLSASCSSELTSSELEHALSSRFDDVIIMNIIEIKISLRAKHAVSLILLQPDYPEVASSAPEKGSLTRL
jgi:hypothetical protein